MTRAFLDNNNKEITVSFINKTYEVGNIAKGIVPGWQDALLFEIEDKYYMEVYNNNQKYRKLIADFECDRNKLRREMNKYKQLCKELLEKCEEYERMGYSELADRAKNDYYRLRNAA